METETTSAIVKPAKKGNRSWQPASYEVLNKKPGYGYRKVAAGTDSIAKHLAEGWEFESAANGADTVLTGGNRVFGGTRLDTVRGGADFVLMRIPEETLKQRNAYFNKRAEAQMSTVGQNLAEQKGEAKAHGETTIQRPNGQTIKTVIED